MFRYATAPWFSSALQLLAASGAHGVAVDVWWSAVERAPRAYNWQGYRQLLELLRPTGLKLQAVLSFHACGGNVGDLVQVPLPEWVLQVRRAAGGARRRGGARERRGRWTRWAGPGGRPT